MSGLIAVPLNYQNPGPTREEIDATRGLVVLEFGTGWCGHCQLAAPAVESALAAIPEVRSWVNAQQRKAVTHCHTGVVVDGRDIGTVVFPDAPLKIYLTAHADARARRRLSQQGEATDDSRIAQESAVLAARDALDAGRPLAPLRAADDAITLDTTTLTLDEQVTRILTLARARFSE